MASELTSHNCTDWLEVLNQSELVARNLPSVEENEAEFADDVGSEHE